MHDITYRRAQARQVTDRLIEEFAPVLPPGRVMAAVVRAQRQLVGDGSPWTAQRTAHCEALARQLLSRRLSTQTLAQTG